MENLLLEPLKFYDKHGKTAHEQNATEYFESLLKKSAVDVEENRKTATLYRKQYASAEKVNQSIKKLKTLRVFLIIGIIAGLIGGLIGGNAIDGGGKIIAIIVGLIVSFSCLMITLLVINKKIKRASVIYAQKKEIAESTLKIAKGQTATLNALFSERDAVNLIEKTLPLIKFDDGYTLSLSQRFIAEFDFLDDINGRRSVLDTLSGRFNENPFLFYRYINHYMGTKVYHGTKIISWTETRRGSNGRLERVRRTQTLHASVTKPYPYYNYGTALSYGNQTSPDLNFSREATDVEDLTEKQVQKRVRKGQKKLAKLAENAVSDGGSFTEMANADFDVLFGAIDRNHEVQFRVMFSPLAQRNMTSLLRAKNIGYGDDFSFYKRGRFNRIVSEHAQRWTMNASPSNYYSYDVDIIRQNFIWFNNEYFKSVFFDLAPLLSIPTYQDKPLSTFEPIQNNPYNYTYYDYEMLANVIGANKFEHPASATASILKTDHMTTDGDTDVVMVTASSYAGESRVDFIPILGGDGRVHPVPVPWVEYIPLEKKSTMAINKVGLTSGEFYKNATNVGADGLIFNSPSAYFHGLFAKVIDRTDVRDLTSALKKIKNLTKEN